MEHAHGDRAGAVSARNSTLLERVRTGFWAIPSVCVVVAIALALGLVEVDRRIEEGLGRLTFGAGADGAREVLSAITTSMITFTGLVFTITIVVLQLTSSQFSPRVLRTFLRDRQTQLSLGVFIATFVYAVLVLRSVSGLDEDTFVPAVATTVGVVLLLVSVGVFVGYIHHIATAIQVSSILHSITDETRETIERELPRGLPVPPVVVVPRGESALVIPAKRSGVLVAVDTRALVEAASRAEVVLVSGLGIGSYVPEGAAVCEVHGEAGELDVEQVAEAFELRRDRTMQHDVAFGFRQLADIIARALSPGVNDPTTAVQGLDGIHDLLRRLATRHLPTGSRSDEEGRIRLHLPRPELSEYLELGLREADQYGAESRQVQERIDELLTELRSCALSEHQEAIEAWIEARKEEGTAEAGGHLPR